jgi:hypothetical protein
VLQGRFNSQEQFKVLHERYPLVNNSTKGLLLSTYLKMLLADPSNSGLQSDVIAVLTKCSHQMDPDLQQRSAEYLVGLPQQLRAVPTAKDLTWKPVASRALCRWLACCW